MPMQHHKPPAQSSGLQSDTDEAEADSLLLAAAALHQMSAHKPGRGQPVTTTNSSSCSSQGNCLAAAPCHVPSGTQGASLSSGALEYAAAAAKGDARTPLQEPLQQQRNDGMPTLEALLQALVARAAPAAAGSGTCASHAPDSSQGARLSAGLVAQALTASTPAVQPAPAPAPAPAAAAAPAAAPAVGALAPQLPLPSSLAMPNTSNWPDGSAAGPTAAPQPPTTTVPQEGADALLEPLQLRSGPFVVVGGGSTGGMPPLSAVRQAIEASALSVYVRPMKVTSTKPKKMQLLESQVASARAVNQHLKVQVEDLQADRAIIDQRVSDLQVNLCLMQEINRRLRLEYDSNREAVSTLSQRAQQQEQQRQVQQQQEQRQRELLVQLIQKLVPQIAQQTEVNT